MTIIWLTPYVFTAIVVSNNDPVMYGVCSLVMFDFCYVRLELCLNNKPPFIADASKFNITIINALAV